MSMANTKAEYEKYDKATIRAASGWTNVAKVLTERKAKPVEAANDEAPRRRGRPPKIDSIEDMISDTGDE